MRRVIVLAALGVLLASAAAAAATPRPGSAGAFMTRILREEIRGQWNLQWQELHPAHQKLINEAQYVACSRRMGTNFATGTEVFKVLDIRNEAIDVKGIPQRTSKLVTINFRQPGKTGLTYHMHAVNVDGRWTWILGGRFLTALSRGQCLDGSPLRASA
jgi:hypothetical protein